MSRTANRTANRTAYRIAVCTTLVAALLLIWFSLGVGIIGRDGDPANAMYFGVLAIGAVGAWWARGRAPAMARVLVAMAAAQTLVAAIALFGGLGRPWSGPAELILLNGFFIIVFAAAAGLFRHAAQ
jgi:hypothetical protein